MAQASLRIELRGFKELAATFKNAPRKVQDIGRAWVCEVGVYWTTLQHTEMSRTAEPT